MGLHFYFKPKVHLRFQLEKSIQAAGVLLDLDGRRMERVRLLHLLYIADRELMAEIGQPLTGDTALVTEQGPIPIEIECCIKGEGARAKEWGRFFHAEGYAVMLREDPGRGELCRAEIEKLTAVTERFRDMSQREIVERTRTFPEWRDRFVADRTFPLPLISWEDALKAQGAEEMIAVVAEHETTRAALDRACGKSGAAPAER